MEQPLKVPDDCRSFVAQLFLALDSFLFPETMKQSLCAVFTLIGKAIGLPDDFLALKEGSKGGGVIQTSASECVLVTMLAARAQAIRTLKQRHPFIEEGHLLSKLMAYCSKEAHSCVEKAAMISFVKLRILEPDSKCSLRGETLTKVSALVCCHREVNCRLIDWP